MIVNQTQVTGEDRLHFVVKKKSREVFSVWRKLAILSFSFNSAVVHLCSAPFPISLLASSYNHFLNQENNSYEREGRNFLRKKFSYVIG